MARMNFPPLKSQIRYTHMISEAKAGLSSYMFKTAAHTTGTKATINWGDGIIEIYTVPTSDTIVRHTYAAAGIYNVKIQDNNGNLRLFSFQSVNNEDSNVLTLEELICPNATSYDHLFYRGLSVTRVSYDLFNYSPRVTILSQLFDGCITIQNIPVINTLRNVTDVGYLLVGAREVGKLSTVGQTEKTYMENVILDGYLAGMKITTMYSAFRIRSTNSYVVNTDLIVDINKFFNGFDFSELKTAYYAHAINSGASNSNILGHNKTVGNLQTLFTRSDISITKLENVQGMFDYCKTLTGDFYPVEQRLLAESPLINKTADDATFGGWGMVRQCTGLTYNGGPYADIPSRWRGGL